MLLGEFKGSKQTPLKEPELGRGGDILGHRRASGTRTRMETAIGRFRKVKHLPCRQWVSGVCQVGKAQVSRGTRYRKSWAESRKCRPSSSVMSLGPGPSISIYIYVK